MRDDGDRSRRRPVDGIQAPLAGESLQLADAQVDEREARSRGHLAHRPRYTIETGSEIRGLEQPCADVDRHPADLAIHDLDLADMGAGPDGDPQGFEQVHHGEGAVHFRGGPVEDREEAVTGGIELLRRSVSARR